MRACTAETLRRTRQIPCPQQAPTGGVHSAVVRRRIAVGVGLALVVVATAALAFLLGGMQALDGLSIKRVTATQIANAMQEDRFYTDYRESTLLVDGVVSSVSMRGSDVIAEFKTDSSFQALYDLGPRSTSSLHAGDRMTVIAEAASAERQPSAVLLNGCVTP
jgi:hypothetical protein